MKNDNQATLFEQAAAAKGSRLTWEHYARQNNRSKVISIAESIFINRVSTLDGNVFFDRDSLRKIADQSLQAADLYVKNAYEHFQQIDKKNDPGQDPV